MAAIQKGRTLLHQASLKGHKEVVELLLGRHADADKADKVNIASDL